MSVPSTTFFNIHKLRRFDGPGWFLGYGFAAGLLVFLVWFAGRPSADRHAVHAQGNGAVGANGLQAPGDGVLGGITGELRAGAASNDSRDDSFFVSEGDTDAEAAAQEEGALAPEEYPDSAYAQDADAMAIGPQVGEVPSQEGALTDSLLDAPAAPAAAAGENAPGDNLRPFYVEVEIAPGEVQMLQLNAESAEHALAILRDFRGNPRVLRGPSPEPLP
jgi:hypothetical protein